MVHYRYKLGSLIFSSILAMVMGCKAHRSQSALEDIKLSPNFPASAQAIWLGKDGKIHLGNCKDCKDSKDAADSIARFDYEVKVRTAAIDMRGEGKKDYGPGLKAVQEKLKSMQEISKASGPDALNDEEKLAFKSQIAVLEQLLGLTEEEKKLIKPIFDALDSQEVITYHEGERRFALARAPFGPPVSSAFTEVKVGWRPFPEQKGTPPSARLGHTAVMIGHKMIIWGGQSGTRVEKNMGKKNDGAVFDFDTLTWTPLPKTDAWPRAFHSAVVIGRKMIIWGGQGNAGAVLDDGWVFDFDSIKWSRIKDAPFNSHGHSAIVSGGEMLVYGGVRSSKELTPEVATYDVDKNDWVVIANEGYSTPLKTGHSAVRMDNKATSDSKMIVWGGIRKGKGKGFDFSGTAFDFDFRSNRWTFATLNSPSSRVNHTAVAIGSKMIIWGGYSNQLHDNGFVLDTSPNSWSPLPTGSEVPAARSSHSAVAFDNKMIIWGGFNSAPVAMSDGWIYEFAKEEK